MNSHWRFGYANLKGAYGPVNDRHIREYLDSFDDYSTLLSRKVSNV